MSEILNKNGNLENMAEAPSESAVSKVDQTVEDAGDIASNTSPTKILSEENSPQVENKKTPVKRTPSKRMSFIERAQKESEELVKNMGGSLELEGGRRTRSSTRGTPTRPSAITPPPIKKARNSPSANTASSRARGRARKIDISEEEVIDEEKEGEQPKSAKKQNKTKNNDTELIEEAKKVLVPNEVNSGSEDSSPTETKKKVSSIEKSVKADEKSNESEVEIKKLEDETDASVVSIQGKAENNLDHASEKEEEKSEQTEKPEPMDTDETVPVVKTSESLKSESVKVAKDGPEIVEKEIVSDKVPVASDSVTEVAIKKQPTPEPMDVDSSSKSNDTVDKTTAIPIEENIIKDEIDGNASSLSSVEPNVPLKTDGIDKKPEENHLEVSKDAKDEDKMLENSKAANNISQNDTAAVEDSVVLSAEKLANAIEKEAIADAKSVSILSNDLKTPEKEEKESCTPKIVSESIAATNESTIPTPQSCN